MTQDLWSVCWVDFVHVWFYTGGTGMLKIQQLLFCTQTRCVSMKRGAIGTQVLELKTLTPIITAQDTQRENLVTIRWTSWRNGFRAEFWQLRVVDDGPKHDSAPSGSCSDKQYSSIICYQNAFCWFHHDETPTKWKFGLHRLCFSSLLCHGHGEEWFAQLFGHPHVLRLIKIKMDLLVR